jgi:hypothetical protein
MPVSSDTLIRRKNVSIWLRRRETQMQKLSSLRSRGNGGRDSNSRDVNSRSSIAKLRHKIWKGTRSVTKCSRSGSAFPVVSPFVEHSNMPRREKQTVCFNPRVLVLGIWRRFWLAPMHPRKLGTLWSWQAFDRRHRFRLPLLAKHIGSKWRR